ncbi:hypothetical protein JYU34_018966 [Plutella xylostella]|uniref:Carboxylic ester hydrolase n=1 Tax=Plutella xylostella TaxID=51655 RepID=A0ABQ7PYX7_PLUXY|nr:hypothetical protein JYU34_018966 [Plutella xylostella]
MLRLAFFAVLLAGALGSSDYTNRVFKESCDGLSAEVDSGKLCGLIKEYKNTTFGTFRGVPYAKPPLAELRFKELQKAEAWEDYLDASVEGSICPQRIILFGPLMAPRSIGEDCINANIHVPLENGALPTKNKLPIIVWVHGGGFTVGSGDSDAYGPEYLMSRGVILITFNYRLGALGFLTLNTPSVPGNNGLRDILTLLRWVQENGAKFGGDVDDVTIFGQSAGASAAHMLLLSPQTQDGKLFQKAILQSGSAVRSFFNYQPAYTATVAQTFLTLMGINSTDPEEIHKQLIEADVEQYMEVSSVMQDATGLPPFGPVIESTHEGVNIVIDKDPEELIEMGRGQNIPMLLGFTEDECFTFRGRIVEVNLTTKFDANSDLALPPALATSPLKDELSPRMKERYVSGENITLDEFQNLCSEAYFKYGVIYTAQRREQLGGAESFLYQFAYRGEHRLLDVLGYKLKKTCHFEDVTYVFQQHTNVSISEDVFEGSVDRDMQNWLVDIVINFVKKSDPAGSVVNWPPISRFLFRYQDIVENKYKTASLLTDTKTKDLVDFLTKLYNDGAATQRG